MAASAFQDAASFDKRREEARRILAKYPDRVPVICERSFRSELPEIAKKKFLVPGTMLCGEFKYIIHKHLNEVVHGSIAADQTVYLFVQNVSPKVGTLLSEIYARHKADDGFLYMTYSAENSLGADSRQ
mmetsp:Transcript_10960/g.25772  ORF Transcript_10960/g.25772 Transcript_10960/m.25772 type:complete len:129 (-) Transcript_10960:92-478(-)|eukprot:CAMPEP_0171100162 /NCGR_PEP_ID=MMETSP0766_2-20121228/52792_1 /TAXON_ID=439317 /ORGANISM="Gambierdiscus australes, Strain CAWD 149" /LENGTH=128 /DNA_ID=CAMNT_0011559935 /DNA_START=61 /DNA_END=447 /DNA_ORIENTATION=+